MQKIIRLPISLIILFSVFIHLMAVIFSEGYHRPDEHLGIMRYVGTEIGKVGIDQLSWEYPARIRTWSQPLIYIGISKMLAQFKVDNPFTLAMFYRLLSSLIALFGTFFFFTAIRHHYKNKKEELLLAAGLFLTWYLPFFHARTSNENLSASAFLFALAIIVEKIPFDRLNNEKLLPSNGDSINFSFSRILLFSFFFALAFHFRFQAAFMIAPLVFWLKIYLRTTWKFFFQVVLSIFIIFLALSLIDSHFYGEWSFTPWNYFDYNILRGKASSFGESPWYYYLTKTLFKGFPPFSLFLLAGFFYIWITAPGSIYTWITLPFFLVHCFIGHKELRFLFPMGQFFIFGLILWIQKNEASLVKRKFLKRGFYLAIALNLILLVPSTFKPAFSQIDMYKFLYYHNDPPQKIYTLGVFRDQLHFYLQGPITQVPVPDQSERNIENWYTQNNEYTQWYLADKYKDHNYMTTISWCQRKWSAYPEWLADILLKFKGKRLKYWALYRCEISSR